MNKTALITGITGQDGSYLAELLLKKGYFVVGLIRRTSLFNRDRIEKVINDYNDKSFKLLYGDLSDSSSLNRIIEKVQPDEIYNLGAQSHVQVSFEVPEYTGDVNGIGALRLLDAIREVGLNSKLYQASSSELYGKVMETPQTESTPFHPRSPYACSKAFAFYITQNYREAYDLFACNGILFNHESPRRSENFVTRKITLSFARIAHGLQDKLTLGNLDAKRDWGYAKDYVEAMWLILQQKKPDDYVIATGENHSVREFVDIAAKEFGYKIEWKGKDDEEKGYDKESGKLLVEVSPKYYRPTEVETLLGDYSKAKKQLGWKPSITFHKIVQIMAKADMKYVQKQKLLIG